MRFSIVRERFATRVRLDRPALTIDVDLLSGPFRRLRCHWDFAADAEGAAAMKGALLRFEIDFEFGSRLLERLLAANFDLAVGKLIASFERRAARIYG